MADALKDAVLAALSRVSDPAKGTDIVSADMVQGLVIKGGAVGFALEVDPQRGAALEPLRKAAEDAAALGQKVGLLDADVYGPSQPRMLGVSGRPSTPDGQTILPLRNYGVTVMSMGFMLEEDQSVVWRGPMLMSALQQMLRQVQWGKLDTLIVDLPPGTGDVQLTLSQKTIAIMRRISLAMAAHAQRPSGWACPSLAKCRWILIFAPRPMAARRLSYPSRKARKPCASGKSRRNWPKRLWPLNDPELRSHHARRGRGRDLSSAVARGRGERRRRSLCQGGLGCGARGGRGG